MKKLILAVILSPAFLVAQDYNYSPTINRNLEMLFDNYLMSYNRLLNIDSSNGSLDTLGWVEVLRDAQGNFIQGREIVEDSLSTIWNCSMQNGVNVVDITDMQNGGQVVQKDRIHRDAMNRDTLLEIYIDTSGNGTLTKFQELKLFYNNFGIDSASLVEQGGGIGDEVIYNMRRNAVGKPDSLVVSISFAGTPYPIQTLIYYENVSGGLDSINLRNNLSFEIEEQIRVKNNANNEVYEFSLYEKNSNDEWEKYDTYVLSTETFFNLMEASQDFSFNFYPNPAQKSLSLSLNQNASYRIFHLSGTLMQSGTYLQGDHIDIEALPQGVYFLQVELNDGRVAGERFLKK